MSAALFIPLLALVAAYSCEATFDTYTSLNSTDPTQNFVNKVNLTVTLVDATGQPKADRGPLICPLTDIVAGNATCTKVSYDADDYIMAAFNTTGMAFAGGLTPMTVTTKACFSLYSSTNRKWRKFDDRFKKDKHCTFIEGDMEAEAPFVNGPMSLIMKVPPQTPSAVLSIQLFVKCEGQGSNEYCAVSDNLRKAKTFFQSEVDDGITDAMTISVFVFAFSGPLIFVLYLVYDKLLKKKLK